MTKERIDVLLTRLGHFGSRALAKQAVKDGLILVNQERITKPSEKVSATSEITVAGSRCPYVSRGGFKLEKALQEFKINLKDKTIIDIGSSTGGFTDCALQNGAKLVYAVDVGADQLAAKLQEDRRVIALERTNFRYMTTKQLAFGLPDFACVDVSFISLKLILPVLTELLAKEGEVVALIKPQFEAGKEQVGKKGVVKNPKIHLKVITEVTQFAHELGFSLLGLTYSPIKGGAGNIEFLVYMGYNEIMRTNVREKDIIQVVNEAHHQL